MILRPVDRVLLAYLAITSVVAIVRLPDAPDCAWVLLANGLMLLGILLTTRAPEHSTAAELFPIVILLALYGALDLLAGHGAVAVHDPAVQRWEADIFGGQVSREWWQHAPSRLWSTLLHAAYFSYYLIVPAGPLWLLWKRDWKGLHRVVLALVTTFVICYLCFIFFPVAGPYYQFPRPSAAFLDNGPARLVYSVLAQGSSYGAAFPSSHVAGVLAAVGALTGSAPRLALVLALPSLLLTVGVVYCQMHYGVDVLAGMLACGAGLGASWLGLRSESARAGQKQMRRAAERPSSS